MGHAIEISFDEFLEASKGLKLKRKTRLSDDVTVFEYKHPCGQWYTLEHYPDNLMKCYKWED